jgi:hypothetical protein
MNAPATRRRVLRSSLIGLSALCIAVTVWEAAYLPNSIAARRAAPLPAAAAPADHRPGGVVARREGGDDAITARPLFQIDRRPYVPDVPQPGDEESKAAESPRLGTLSLSAIVITAEERMALIRSDAGKIERIAEGDEIDGWTLTAISPEGVSLEHSGQVQRLEFKHPEAKPRSQ